MLHRHRQWLGFAPIIFVLVLMIAHNGYGRWRQMQRDRLRLAAWGENRPDGGSESRGPYGMTPLMIAAEAGNTLLVQQLLRQGASLHAMDSLGNIPLAWGAESGNVQVAGLLLGKGINVNAGAGQNGPPLLWAALSG